MTPEAALVELLGRVGAGQDAAVLVSEDELYQWPSTAVAAMKTEGLLVKVRPSTSAICPGCERECVMPVHILADKKHTPEAFIVCDKRSDINRVALPISQLEQWKASSVTVANLLAGLLDLRRPGNEKASISRWEIGMLKGRKHSSHLVLLADDSLTLTFAGHSIALVDVLALEEGNFTIDKRKLTRLVDQPVAGAGDDESTAQRRERLKKRATAEKATDHMGGLEIGTPKWRSENARRAANVRHDKPGGSRDKHRQIREVWASGIYKSRDLCAEQECGALDMSISAARNALKNTPNP